MSEPLKPPSISLAILNFFASQPNFPALEGDLSEEFHQRAEISGENAARRWYWRQVFRNSWALTVREVFQTPVRTTLVALVCLFGVDVLTTLYAFIRFYPLPALQLFYNGRHRNVAFLVTFVAALATGWIGGRLLRGREWALALTFTIIWALLTLPRIWQLLFIYPVPIVSTPLWDYAVYVWFVRQVGFFLGSLWSRKSRTSMAVAGRV
ncbi:MAG: permease prefix domain 2-containing transporter [Acidobacteriia bacterium]|nr:permease prefix domain 2-containing transporter [Terriglobia bacterium]